MKEEKWGPVIGYNKKELKGPKRTLEIKQWESSKVKYQMTQW